MHSVLELENALGGDPGPGLGGKSDFDKRQLQKAIWLNSNWRLFTLELNQSNIFGWVEDIKLTSLLIVLSDQVGSGSPGQFGSASRFDSAKGGISFGAGGGISAGAGGGISAGAPGGKISAGAPGGKASGSFGRVPSVEGSNSSRGSNRQRRPSGNQVDVFQLSIFPSDFYLSIRSLQLWVQGGRWQQRGDRRIARVARVAREAKKARVAGGARIAKRVRKALGERK